MNQQGAGLTVLASIPDLSESASHAGIREQKCVGLLASHSRLIGQAVSVKLLAGMALFLIVGAVLPYCMKCFVPANASPASESLAAWHPESTEASPEVAAGGSEAIAQTAAVRPPVRIAAAAEPSRAPAMLPPPTEVQSQPQPHPIAETPLMSSWPNAAHAAGQSTEVGADAAQPGANRPMAIRPAEFQADARAGQGDCPNFRPSENGTVPLEAQGPNRETRH